MGLRGPPPTPTAILKVRGSWRAKLKTGFIVSDGGLPTCPSNLTDEQKAVWRAVVNRLRRIPGLLAKIDAPQLTRYCLQTTQWWLMQDVIAKFNTPDLVAGALSNDTLRRVIRCAMREARELAAELCRTEAKFGMTPSDRTRIRIERNLQQASSPKRFFRKEA